MIDASICELYNNLFYIDGGKIIYPNFYLGLLDLRFSRFLMRLLLADWPAKRC